MMCQHQFEVPVPPDRRARYDEEATRRDYWACKRGGGAPIQALNPSWRALTRLLRTIARAVDDGRSESEGERNDLPHETTVQRRR